MSDDTTNTNDNAASGGDSTDDSTVVMYSTPTCGFCHMAKEYFKNKDIEFVVKDITTDSDAYKEVLDSTGQLGVPVIKIADSPPIIGFDRPKIDLALREAKLV